MKRRKHQFLPKHYRRKLRIAEVIRREIHYRDYTAIRTAHFREVIRVTEHHWPGRAMAGLAAEAESR